MRYSVFAVFFSGVLLLSCASKNEYAQNSKLNDKPMKDKIMKSDEEWKKELSPEEYRVLREKGTERAFTGKYYQNHDDGIYYCAACDNPLFSSKTKFESGSGWPSFYEPIPGGIESETDNSFGMARTEILCARCGGHLGHVFDDGPKPTGLRYCINSVSLDFKKE